MLYRVGPILKEACSKEGLATGMWISRSFCEDTDEMNMPDWVEGRSHWCTVLICVVPCADLPRPFLNHVINWALVSHGSSSLRFSLIKLCKHAISPKTCNWIKSSKFSRVRRNDSRPLRKKHVPGVHGRCVRKNSKSREKNKTQATWINRNSNASKRFRKGSFVKTSVWLSLTPWLDVLRVARWLQRNKAYAASMSTKRIRTTTTQQKRKRKRKEEEEEDEAEHHQEYTSTTRARTT